MEKYRFYYFSDYASDNYSSVTHIMKKNFALRIKIESIIHSNKYFEIISEIAFGYFESEGTFVTSNNRNAITIKSLNLYPFQLEIIQKDKYNTQQILTIEYKMPLKQGVIKFRGSSNRGYFFSENELISIIEKLHLFISKNHDLIVQRDFVESLLSKYSLYPNLEHYIQLADNITCKKIESSKYVPAKENKFYTHIEIQIPNNASKYFITLLLDFCSNDLKREGGYSEKDNCITYLDYYDSMWQPDHEDKISKCEWKLEKVRFIIYLCKFFDENQCLIETILKAKG